MSHHLTTRNNSANSEAYPQTSVAQSLTQCPAIQHPRFHTNNHVINNENYFSDSSEQQNKMARLSQTQQHQLHCRPIGSQLGSIDSNFTAVRSRYENVSHVNHSNLNNLNEPQNNNNNLNNQSFPENNAPIPQNLTTTNNNNYQIQNQTLITNRHLTKISEQELINNDSSCSSRPSSNLSIYNNVGTGCLPSTASSYVCFRPQILNAKASENNLNLKSCSLDDEENLDDNNNFTSDNRRQSHNHNINIVNSNNENSSTKNCNNIHSNEILSPNPNPISSHPLTPETLKNQLHTLAKNDLKQLTSEIFNNPQSISSKILAALPKEFLLNVRNVQLDWEQNFGVPGNKTIFKFKVNPNNDVLELYQKHPEELGIVSNLGRMRELQEKKNRIVRQMEEMEEIERSRVDCEDMKQGGSCEKRLLVLGVLFLREILRYTPII